MKSMQPIKISFLNHMFEHGRKVFGCFLDVSKPFDKVWIAGVYTNCSQDWVWEVECGWLPNICILALKPKLVQTLSRKNEDSAAEISQSVWIKPERNSARCSEKCSGSLKLLLFEIWPVGYDHKEKFLK